MTTYDDIFPQSAEEMQKEAQSIRQIHEEEQEQADRILNEFLTAAAEIKKICLAYEYNECEKCPYYDPEERGCLCDYYTTGLKIDTIGWEPHQWYIAEWDPLKKQ